MAESAHGETTSKSNQHEAELCVRLCRYLLQQGYPPDTITILTAYTGQVLLLRGIINKDREFYTGKLASSTRTGSSTQVNWHHQQGQGVLHR